MAEPRDSSPASTRIAVLIVTAILGFLICAPLGVALWVVWGWL